MHDANDDAGHTLADSPSGEKPDRCIMCGSVIAAPDHLDAFGTSHAGCVEPDRSQRRSTHGRITGSVMAWGTLWKRLR
jgi:hypothetical protein